MAPDDSAAFDAAVHDLVKASIPATVTLLLVTTITGGKPGLDRYGGKPRDGRRCNDVYEAR
jgi:hypothetical protein